MESDSAFFVSDCFESILSSSVLPLLVFFFFFYCLLLSINSLYEYTIQSFFFLIVQDSLIVHCLVVCLFGFNCVGSDFCI